MGSIAECLAKQALGSIGVAQRRQQEIDGGPPGIDGPVQVAPATLHAEWSKRQGVVEAISLSLLPEPDMHLSAHPALRSSVAHSKGDVSNHVASLLCISLIIKGLHLTLVS